VGLALALHDVAARRLRDGRAVSGEQMYKVIERDPYGNERELANTATPVWTSVFTKEQAEACVAWREANITRKYWYEIVPAPDGEAARDASS
jgi:hypothetical protein